MNIDKIKEYVSNRLVSEQKHPELDLYIYNYTQKVQFERLWDEVTLNCRGLILNGNGDIIARPFPKFFNYEELTEIPQEPFEVYKKMDGSLGILYWLDNKPCIATRGSFTSEQATWATEFIQSKDISKLDRNLTYLFEIIYPENRIVIDYKNKKDLVLLAIRDKQGNEYPLQNLGFTVVEKFEWNNDILSLKDLNINNEEGFVIKFKSGYRVKLKFAEYVRLHRLITNFSNKSIWECLKNKQDINEYLDRVPDEFFDWVRKTKNALLVDYLGLEANATEFLRKNKTTGLSRKELAELFKTQEHPSILFNMIDGKDYSQYIWKQIKPQFSKPFKNDIDA